MQNSLNFYSLDPFLQYTQTILHRIEQYPSIFEVQDEVELLMQIFTSSMSVYYFQSLQNSIYPSSIVEPPISSYLEEIQNVLNAISILKESPLVDTSIKEIISCIVSRMEMLFEIDFNSNDDTILGPLSIFGCKNNYIRKDNLLIHFDFDTIPEVLYHIDDRYYPLTKTISNNPNINFYLLSSENPFVPGESNSTAAIKIQTGNFVS